MYIKHGMRFWPDCMQNVSRTTRSSTAKTKRIELASCNVFQSYPTSYTLITPFTPMPPRWPTLIIVIIGILIAPLEYTHIQGTEPQRATRGVMQHAKVPQQLLSFLISRSLIIPPCPHILRLEHELQLARCPGCAISFAAAPGCHGE